MKETNKELRNIARAEGVPYSKLNKKGLEEIQYDIPSKDDMLHVGLSESRAIDFCVFLREYEHTNDQSIGYWVDLYLEFFTKIHKVNIKKIKFNTSIKSIAGDIDKRRGLGGIMERHMLNGIVLGMGNNGYGFYLSNQFNTAIKWGTINSNKIWGRVDISWKVDSFKGLDLFNNKEEWERVVKYYRSYISR